MFDFSNFSKVGDKLSEFDDEEYLRSAIGRYYYSIFCSARQYLVETKNKRYFLKRNDIHKMVSEELLKSNDLTEHYIGDTLEKLREIRNNADYDWIDKDFLYYKTNMSIVKNKSKKALESLEALKNYPPYD